MSLEGQKIVSLRSSGHRKEFTVSITRYDEKNGMRTKNGQQ